MSQDSSSLDFTRERGITLFATCVGELLSRMGISTSIDGYYTVEVRQNGKLVSAAHLSTSLTGYSLSFPDGTGIGSHNPNGTTNSSFDTGEPGSKSSSGREDYDYVPDDGKPPDAAYFLDRYGTCRTTPCRCLDPKRQWLGRLCPNWVPLGATSFETLRRIP